MPLRRLIAAGTDLPLHIDNGAKTLGQAEMWFGVGRRRRMARVTSHDKTLQKLQDRL
ncbi:hypothetical protein ABT346_24495 [Micromonospora peucetia]|uniref:hypothetical protein n=1 Tax=Micromonospora peucetia TaxID=47871 RepID=UPI00333250BC